MRVSRVPDGGICPQAAVDDRGRLHLIYFRGDARRGDLFHAASDDGGHTFGAAERVNGKPGTVMVIGGVRGPSLAVGRGGRLHITWTTTDKPMSMAYARSTDGGKFEPPRDATRDHPGLDGGGSVAADSAGNVYLAWHAPADGGQTEADRRVWLSRSTDDGRTFAQAVAIGLADRGCCACCATQVSAAGDGRVFVVYRTAVEQVHRDVTVLASTDHGTTFTVTATDPWQASTCVMSTSVLAISGRRSLAAWETRGHILVADVSRPAAKPVQASGPVAGSKHPAVAINRDGRSVVAWAEGTGWNKGGSVAWQMFDADGRSVAGQSGGADGLPAWDAPAVVAMPDGAFNVIY